MNEDCDGWKYPVKVEISELGEGKKLYSCSICNDGFDTKTATRNHLWDCHEIDSLDENTNNTTIENTDLIKEIHECQFCDMTYPSKTQLCRHLRLKHGVKTYKKHQVPDIELFPSIKNLKSCNVTIKVEPSLDNVTDEDLEDENTKITSITNTDPFKDTFTVNPWQVESIEAFAYLKCPECVFDCKEEVIFQDHAVENHPLSNVLFDVECNFFEKIEVKEELSDISVVKQEVPEILNSVEENESIETDVSKNRSNQKFSLGQKSVYDKNDSFSCHICQISFNQKKHYKAHITHLNQNGTRSLKCCACDKKFNFENGLGNSKFHMRLKHPEIPYPVEENENIETKFSIDQSDQKFSIGQKPVYDKNDSFSCHICQISFEQKKHYIAHITHLYRDGTKSFKCCACDTKFSSGNGIRDLIKHIASLHKGNNLKTGTQMHNTVYDKNDLFSCHICQISFDQKKHYKAHITHLDQDGTRSLKCCACDKKFSFGNGIRVPINHIEKVHLGNSKSHLKLKYPVEEGKKQQVPRIKLFPSINNMKASNITIIENPSIDNITEEVHNTIDIEKIINKDNGIIKEEISVNEDPSNTSVGDIDYDSENSLKELIHEGKKNFVCSFCDHSYHRKSHLREHVKIVHEGKKRRSLAFKCYFCTVIFIHFKDLKQHIGTEHEGKKPHNCSLCNSGFILKAQLTRHFKAVHEKSRPHKCPVCNKGFSEARGLSHHIAHVHEGKKLYSCPICNDGFDTKMATKNHLLITHEIPGEKLSMYGYKSYQTQTPTYLNTITSPPIISYEQKEDTQMEIVHEFIPSIAQKPVYDRSDTNSCHTCQITFNQRKYYRSHITSLRDGKKVKRCCACNATFSFGNNRHLMKHVVKVHEGKPYRCSFCSDCFSEKEELVKHKLSVHEGKKLAFKCAICHADFALKSTLKTHMEAVHEDIESMAQKPVKERVKCLQCDKTYSNRKELENHVEVVHLQLKKFQCDQCPLNFASKNGFEYHVASKHEKKEHSCTQCDRIYKTKIGLKDHVLRFHEKRLDFKCEYCGKEFPSLAEVNRHVRLIHHGIKVKCDLCDKEISNSLRLWKHKVFHHNETKDAWICKKCPRKRWSAFQTQAIYDKHMKEVHEGIKPNKCNICSRMFSTMKTLNLHISKIHEASEENQHHMAKKKST